MMMTGIIKRIYSKMILRVIFLDIKDNLGDLLKFLQISEGKRCKKEGLDLFCMTLRLKTGSVWKLQRYLEFNARNNFSNES